MNLISKISNIGEFVEDSKIIAEKLKNIKAIIFDWDGVFHTGHKKNNKDSSFSEADSMGVNMLRFSYYLKDNKIPYTAIITGENNETASYFAKREHFNEIFLKAKNKIKVLDAITKDKGFSNEEVLFVFDDILDLSMAKVCGLRFMINREASFMLNSYCKDNKLCDYITKNDGGNHGIREVCELSISFMGNYKNVIEKRMNYSKEYSDYIELRNSKTTEFMYLENDNVEPLE